MEWYNLIFYIPIVFGALMAVGSLFGLGGDHDADTDHDLDHDMDHDVESETDADGDHDRHTDWIADHAAHEQPFYAKALSLLGVGRVPLTVVLTMAPFIFGGIGVSLNAFLAPVLPTLIYPWISFAGAFFGGLFLTGKASKLLAHILPKTESYNISRSGMVGSMGEALFDVNETSGFALVRDPSGDVHQIPCLVQQGVIPKGGGLIVIEYLEEKKVFLVESPPSLPMLDSE